MFKPLIDFDNELETNVLGVLLVEPRAYSMCYNLLMVECFYNADNLLVYNAIDKLHKEGYPLDLLTVSRHFYNQGETQIAGVNVAYHLSQVASTVVNSAHLEHWCLMLRELALKRATIALTSSGVNHSDDPLTIASDIDQKLKKILEIRSTDDWKDGSKVGIELSKHMEAMSGKAFNGITTSFKELNDLNGGFKPGNLVVIASRPSVGKSALLGRMAINAAILGHGVGVVSLEMENKDILARMVSFNSEVPFWRIDRSQFIEADQHKKVLQEISNLASLPIHYSDTATVSMRDIRAKVEKLMRRNKVDLIIIDYLQLIEPESEKGRNREQEVAKISRGCKILAKTLQIPVIILAQLNREADGQEPQLKHLRESGSLEADADIVMLLHRVLDSEDEAVKRQAFLFVRKWRNGSTTKIELDFNGETMRFTEKGENQSNFKPIPSYRDITEPNKNEPDRSDFAPF